MKVDDELLKHLVKFADRFTSMSDKIIYESQYGIDPVDEIKSVMEDNF